MGRHYDPNPVPFYNSFTRAVLRGLLALVLSFALYILLAGLRGDAGAGLAFFGGGDTPAPTEAATAPAPLPTEPPATTSAPTQPPATPTATDDEPPETPTGTPTATIPPDAPEPGETSVQVLDGAGDSAATEAVVALLRELGYEVVAVNATARSYDETTVFYSQGQEAAAEALRARDPRFAEIAANPNLSEDVNVHVVVGSDWQ